MTAFNFTSTEIKSGKLSQDHLQEAVRALQEDGVVILNEIADRQHMDLLREKMLEDVAQILERPDAPFNFNRGNVQQDPPPFPPYLFRDVLLNDLVIAITKELLGAGLKNAFYSGNTALPQQGDLPKGGGRQPVHVDMGQLWPNLTQATPPFALVVNVLPVDVSPQNGSTEIWPGTHKDTSVYVQQGDLKISQEALEQRRKVSPPFQPSAPAGSVIIRDMRLWHAGMPNQTSTPRPMIAMIHWVSWWNDISPISFPRGTEGFFEHPDLKTYAEFVDGPIEYLGRHEAFDLMK
jgi:hypothetical protein